VLVTTPITEAVTKAETQAKLLNRLRRIEGQVRGLQHMIEEERDCREVLTLLSGIRSALDASSDVIFETYLEGCEQRFREGRGDSEELLATLRLARR
jgi:DNA-binding FrmR family transcriptional regulator